MNATSVDAIQLMNGKPFSVRDGDVAVMYFNTETECLIHADRQKLKAYVTERDGSRSFSTSVTLRQIFGYPVDRATPAEQIAESVRNQLTGDANAPLSPLSKERAIRILQSTCKDKPLSFEAYKILYPYSNKEQFDRIWTTITNSEETLSNEDILSQFAFSRGCLDILDHVLSCDSNRIACSEFDIKAVTEVSEMCVKLGMSDKNKSSKMIKDLSRFDSLNRIEKSIGLGLSEMLKNKPVLRRMIVNGNEHGAIEFIQNLGYDNSDAKDIFDELTAIAHMIAKV